MKGDVLLLSDADLEGLGIRPSEIADAIETAISDKQEGHLHVAPKSAIIPGAGRYMMTTLSVGDGPGLTVVKVATVSPDNEPLPSINGTVLVLDAETGLLRAVMGAGWITAHRTAALSAVAARRLANPKASAVAFIGCGVQARSHLSALAELFPLSEIRAFGRGMANRDRLCRDAEALGLSAIPATTPQAALESADLVVTSVPLDYTITPFLDANWLKPGAFAAITDLGIPWHKESFSAFGSFVVDDLAQEMSAERPFAPPEQITGDLATLCADPPVRDPETPSAFIFRGIALGDFAAAALAMSRAEQLGSGHRLPAWAVPKI